MVDEISKDKALKTVAKVSSITFAGMLSSQIILYLLRLVLARALTPSEYGLLFLGLSFISVLMTFVMLGLGGSIERYVPYYNARNDQKRVRGIILSTFKITLPFSALACILVFFFSDEIATSFFHEPSLSLILKIFSFTLPIFVIYKTFSCSTMAFKAVKYEMLSWHVGRSLATLFAVIAFWILGFGLIGSTVGYAIGFATSAILSFIFFEKRIFPLLGSKLKSIPAKKELLAFSIPLLVSGVLLDVMDKVDTFMLGILKTSTDVGIYQTAWPTSRFVYVIPGALAAIFIPVVSELLSRNKGSEIEKVYKTVNKWILYINLPMLLVFIAYPNAVINILFGSEYLEAGMCLRILSITYFINSMSILSSGMINLHKKTKYHIINAGTSLVISVVFNYMLIPIYGINGAALSTLITFSVYTFMIMAEAYFISGYSPFHNDMIKAMLAGIISITGVFILTKTLFTELNVFLLTPMFIIFITAYSLLILVFRGLGEDDIMILKGVEEKTGIRIKPLRNLIKRFI
jgi:O-antigen/teichoic acid export membrane protein